jgi:hypothetical protein
MVLLTVKTLAAASVNVPVLEVIVVPLIVVAVRSPKACVPVKVCPASVLAMEALVVGNIIVVPSVPTNVIVLFTVKTLPATKVRPPPLIVVTVIAPKTCVPVNVWPASVLAKKAFVAGKVNVVPLVPLNVMVALTVSVTPGPRNIDPFPNIESDALLVTPP